MGTRRLAFSSNLSQDVRRRARIPQQMAVPSPSRRVVVLGDDAEGRYPRHCSVSVDIGQH